jgi:hypothetical protein
MWITVAAAFPDFALVRVQPIPCSSPGSPVGCSGIFAETIWPVLISDTCIPEMRVCGDPDRQGSNRRNERNGVERECLHFSSHVMERCPRLQSTNRAPLISSDETEFAGQKPVFALEIATGEHIANDLAINVAARSTCR